MNLVWHKQKYDLSRQREIEINPMRQLLSVGTVDPWEVYQVSQTVRATSGQWLFVRMTQQIFFSRLNRIRIRSWRGRTFEKQTIGNERQKSERNRKLSWNYGNKSRSCFRENCAGAWSLSSFKSDQVKGLKGLTKKLESSNKKFYFEKCPKKFNLANLT